MAQSTEKNLWGLDSAQRYLLAVVFTSLTVAARFAIEPIVSDRLFFIVFFPLLLFVGGFCGCGPSFVALGLSAFALDFLFIPPTINSKADRIGLIIYIVCGIITALLSRLLHSTHKKLVDQTAERVRHEVELKRASDLCEEREEQFEFMADAIPQILYTCTPEGVFSFVNRRGMETGNIWETIQKNRRHIHPDDLDRISESWDRSLATGDPFLETYRILDIRNRYRWYRCQATPQLNGDGGIAKWYGIKIDVDDLKRKEIALEEEAIRRISREFELEMARRDAVRANEAKDRFLGIVSHELRTPLSPVTLIVSALRGRPDLPEDIREYMVEIEKQLKEEIRVIDDVITQARFRNTKMIFRWEVANLHFLIEDTVRYCDDTIREANLNVTLELDAKNHFVNGDVLRLKEVVRNIVGNAGKFASRGNLKIRSWNEEERVIVEFADNGIGFTEEQLSRIFAHFEQGENSLARRYGGLGLGLSVGRFIMDAHSGSLSAHSDGPKQGSAFQLSIPYVEEGFIPPERRAVLEVRTGEVTILTGARILFVEDNQITLKLIGDILRNEGMEVTLVSDLKETRNVVGEFDLLLSDIGLPDGTGFDVLNYVKGIHPHIVSVAMTGWGVDDLGAELGGFDYHVVKPVDAEQLVEIIKIMMARVRRTVDERPSNV